MSDVGAVDVLRERVVFEREVVVADVLPRSSHYALHLLNCENIGNYTHGPNGTAPYALSLNMEVQAAPAFSGCSPGATCAASRIVTPSGRFERKRVMQLTRSPPMAAIILQLGWCCLVCVHSTL